MFVVYTVVFVTWFIFFQIYSDSLSALNIQSVRGDLPVGL